jgi:hypothetical protein
MKYLISHWAYQAFYFPNMSVSDHGEFRFIEIENLGEWILQNSATYDIMVVSVNRPDLPTHRIILDTKGKLFRTR